MIKPRLDNLLERVDSHYACVLVTAKRARQINSYYHNLREGGTPELTVLEAGEVMLDLRTRRASVDGASIELSAREFTMLEVFLRHPGQVLSREQLLSHVWGYDHDPGSNVVDVYVGYLRRKLGKQRIVTVRGMGYALHD